MLACDSPLNRFASATLGNDSMTLQKAPPTTALNRTDSPRRETLRHEFARSKPTGRRAGLKPRLVLASASPRRLMLLGQALHSLNLGTVDLKRLSQKHGDSEFLTSFIAQEMKEDKDRPDAGSAPRASPDARSRRPPPPGSARAPPRWDSARA